MECIEGSNVRPRHSIAVVTKECKGDTAAGKTNHVVVHAHLQLAPVTTGMSTKLYTQLHTGTGTEQEQIAAVDVSCSGNGLNLVLTFASTHPSHASTGRFWAPAGVHATACVVLI